MTVYQINSIHNNKIILRVGLTSGRADHSNIGEMKIMNIIMQQDLTKRRIIIKRVEIHFYLFFAEIDSV